MQIWLWYVNHRGEDGHIRSHTSVLIRLVKHTSHVFIYSSKQQCLVKTRWFGERGGGRTCGWVCKAWLAVLDRRRDLNGGKEVGRGTASVPSWVLDPSLFSLFLTVPLHQSSPLSFTPLLCPSPLPLLSSFILSACARALLMSCTCACWIAASACTRGGLLGSQSCVAKAAVPPHMSPSSLPRSRSFCLEGGRDKHTNICFTLVELLESPEDMNSLQTLGVFRKRVFRWLSKAKWMNWPSSWCHEYSYTRDTPSTCKSQWCIYISKPHNEKADNKVEFEISFRPSCLHQNSTV